MRGRADKELRRLQSQLDRQMQKMQRSVSEAEADYQVVWHAVVTPS